MADKVDRKTLRELLNLSKSDSSLVRPLGNQVALSRARFFCRYLLEKEMLWPIYHAMKGRDWRETAHDPGGIAVIEKKLSIPLDQVAADFRQWFKKEVIPEPSTAGP